MNTIEDIKCRLIQICENFFFSDNIRPDKIIIEAPYIPYIPSSWDQNRILVLFESQNLSGAMEGNAEYEDELEKLSKADQIRRLYTDLLGGERIGISPWDLGYLDFPLKVCFPEFDRADFAVGNSVLWSLAKNGKNDEPSKFLIEQSSRLWKEFLSEMQPKTIIAVGDISSQVIKNAAYSDGIILNTYFPYGRYPSFINKHFDFSVDLDTYDDVKYALEKIKKTLDSPISSLKKGVTLKKTLPMAISLLQKLKRINND